jgi:disulfide bond formation protein DsbB
VNLQACTTELRRAEPYPVAVLFALGCILTIAGFLFFQYVVGLPPCPLCLEQRYAFYFGVALAIMLGFGASHGASSKVMMLGFAALTLMMLYNAGLGAYHAGIEWKFWPGPAECSGTGADFKGTGTLLNQLQSGISVVRCDQAAWRLFGISLPGWNVLVSGALAVLAGWGGYGVYSRRADAPKT